MSEARPAKMTAARFARLHNEGVNRLSDELSFEPAEKPGIVVDDRKPCDFGAARQTLRKMRDFDAHWRGQKAYENRFGRGRAR